MKKFAFSVLLVAAVGCGSSTTSSGTSPTPTPSAGNFCGQFLAGDGLICDTTTNPPTLKVNIGTSSGQVAAGDDPRIVSAANKGKYLGSFLPSQTQSNPPTMASPGGQMPAGSAAATAANAGGVGQIIFNNVSGRVGVRAANEICAAITDWPGMNGQAVASAHACSMGELVQNVHLGNIPSGANGMAWVTTPTITYTGTATTTRSQNGDCGNWTYNSADLFQGTRWDVGPQVARNNLADSSKAIAVNFTPAQACNTVLPVACCM